MAKYNEKGQELPDQTPVELPIGYKVPETLTEMIARMVRIHSVAALKQELESFEEADDFETEDEEPTSAHQMTQMEEDQPRYKPSILKTDRRGSDQEKKPPAEPAEPAAALTKK